MNEGKIWTDVIERFVENLTGKVPCSRYGRDAHECAPIAIAAALILEAETGEELTAENLEHSMGLVVNDSDEIESLLADYGPDYGFGWTDEDGFTDAYGTVLEGYFGVAY